jgi:ubiquinone/menaquinone biosynthesis C-methylase UbiE
MQQIGCGKSETTGRSPVTLKVTPPLIEPDNPGEASSNSSQPPCSRLSKESPNTHLPSGRFFLFDNYQDIEAILAAQPVADFFSLTAKMRSAVQAQSPAWVLNKDFVDYANICHWMIRKLEYSFAIKALFEIEHERSAPLHILDLGCGVVPLSNYLSLRGHLVIGVDPDVDVIHFANEHLNSFFHSKVDYRVARAEQLPFSDNSFDAVLMVSVLEHIPPGNDRLALSEAARVLKPDGRLILTFDVSPTLSLLEGEPQWDEGKRRYSYPFSPQTAAGLLDEIRPYFEIHSSPFPTQFAELSWNDVHNFWKDNQAHDERASAIREYLAIGATLKPMASFNQFQPSEIKDALLEGQTAIAQQLAFYQHHASQRLQIIHRLTKEIDGLRIAVEEHREAIALAHQEAYTTIHYHDELTLARQSLSQKENEIAYLRQEIHSQFLLLEQQLNAIRETYDEKEFEAAFLRTKYNEAETEINNLRLSIEEKQQQLSQLAAQFFQAQSHFQEERAESRSLAEARLERIDQLAKQSAQRDTLYQQEKERLSDDLATMREQVVSLKAEQRQLYSVLEAKQQLVEATQRTIEEQAHVFNIQQEAHAKSFENAYLIAEARLRVIEEQQAALERLKNRSLRERLKRHIAPQLGVLYQYPPRPMMIHKKYLKERLRSAPPTISIVTPSYNQGKFIERTLRSVLDQAYPNLEYIIQDGASSDETMQIVQKYGDRLKHYESVIDSGQTNALNLGFRHATGEIMAYLNSDDLLLPGSLTYVANYFLQHPDVDVLYGHRIVVDEYDQEVGRWVLPTHNNEVLSWADYIPQETLFWRRSVWQKAGGTMDESFRFAMDWDLILRLREAKARFARVPRYLGAFRIHPHQKTSAQMTEIGTQEMNRLRERCNGRPVSHQEISQQTRPYMIRHILYSRFIHLIERFQKNTVSVSFL